MGRLRRPFKAPVIITQPWGPTSNTFEPSYFGYPHFHLGVDYALPIGTCILAPGAGKVAFAGWDQTGFGDCIKIDHGGGLFSVLGHLSGFKCQIGDEVGVWELVGLSGSTGNSTGPHLHFGVLYGGEWRPPANWIFGNG